MKELIKVCQAWIDQDDLVGKKIQIRDSSYNVELNHKHGIKCEFTFYIGKLKNEEEKEFLTLINNLIKYRVEDNLPF